MDWIGVDEISEHGIGVILLANEIGADRIRADGIYADKMDWIGADGISVLKWNGIIWNERDVVRIVKYESSRIAYREPQNHSKSCY